VTGHYRKSLIIKLILDRQYSPLRATCSANDSDWAAISTNKGGDIADGHANDRLEKSTLSRLGLVGLRAALHTANVAVGITTTRDGVGGDEGGHSGSDEKDNFGEHFCKKSVSGC
jgi:hypothetical protein